MLAGQLDAFFFQLALLEFEILVGDFHESFTFFVFDIDNIGSQAVNVLDAQRRLQ
jgi:hypothetical protein